MQKRRLLFAAALAWACRASVNTGSPDAGPLGAIDPASSVLQHHNHASRDGLYVDPAFTHAAAAGLHRDLGFAGQFTGHVYAQPLWVDRGGRGDQLIVATESNEVLSLDSAGLVRWTARLGQPVPRSTLECGNVDPVGVTGTPIVDAAAGTLYAAAMVLADGGRQRHLVFALALEDGSVRAGWPVDVGAALSGFNAPAQNQRGALALLSGTLFVPYGGHSGDCGDYRGVIVAIPTATPSAPYAWSTRASKGGIWSPAGLSSDGRSIFAATGNTEGATAYGDGEALLRFAPGSPLQPADSFAPSTWKQLDDADTDLSGSGALLVHVAGGAPSELVVALGKDGKAWLAGRDHLGGIGGQLASVPVSTDPIITAPATLPLASGALVVFHGSPLPSEGCSGDLTAIRLTAGTPPGASFAWCAQQNGQGAPIVTTTDGSSQALVWAVGSEGDGRLRAFDAATGAVVFSGGGPSEHIAHARRFVPPIVAGGRVFVAADNQVLAFTTR